MLTVYGTRSCAACRLTRDVLERTGAPFRVVDLEQHPEKADELRAAGHRTLPVIEHAGQSWSGFQLDRLRDAIAHSRGGGTVNAGEEVPWVPGPVARAPASAQKPVSIREETR